ncbi:IclR family transcriptional regulator [Mycolicibacterium smegmatis]|jgi:DNA-binding IclR family transcriptional regulator|uniref:Transcriptional regulator IclR n=2 Tax=Mycolicibacterium smegmatis (strain ATCC 700084 / mc(2)155) TaxID=246196 RepID=I7FFB9_MYCS2|nr:IclR family transcriptional regulator [Mycolicibacterium smegmatis]ABK70924.1 transcriptional regulator, IclR family protein [Mycolicibacterium smegmatis MC2 155]AFP40155.1 Transcriptional regulator IclR [Mycolicibacterium smegmatis MC2 155]AIU08904.1 IclR family transcriptional regulator [Mycolicibacterium smegmatis MC2 155]AIU15529.1 IclR family transcriptional regulator [Mycolicibacterium smegmatis]AIU22152.1 IclR family transcriptional regulator [Mycolicibacterium smegmatis]
MSQSVARALHLLIQLGNGPATLDELAQSTGVHKTTVLRLLRTLADERFTFRDQSNRYHLGSRVFELAARGTDQREIRAIASPHLVAFNRAYGRTTHLAAMEGNDIVYIDKLESHDQIRMFSRIGLSANLNSTAVAKVILADLPDAELRPFVATMDFTRRTPNTITTPEAFLAEIDKVRAQGWAQDREENEPSINCIGVPIRGASGRVVAAVSVSVPNVVLPFEEVLDLLGPLQEVGERISRDCGYLPTVKS